MKNSMYIAILLSALNLQARHSHFLEKNPVLQNGTWALEDTLSQESANSSEGVSVALSADGNTLAAGAPGYNPGGVTQIYGKSGSAWYYQATLTENILSANEGGSVSISADGSTLAVGADCYNTGATLIYIKLNGTWYHQATLSQNTPNSFEGWSVSLSADGNTLAAGNPKFNNWIGTTQIYVRSGSDWMHQATVAQGFLPWSQGMSVSLSADGNTLAVGEFANNTAMGATRIYVRSGSTWKYQTFLSQGVPYSQEGWSVALSADGNTLAAGSPDYNLPLYNYTGATQIYIQSSTAWYHQATLTRGLSGGDEGASVSLSADGNTLAAGIPDRGETQIYARTGTMWNHQANLTQGLPFSDEGNSVSLSGDGNTLAAGDPGFTDQAGGTFLYVNE